MCIADQTHKPKVNKQEVTKENVPRSFGVDTQPAVIVEFLGVSIGAPTQGPGIPIRIERKTRTTNIVGRENVKKIWSLKATQGRFKRAVSHPPLRKPPRRPELAHYCSSRTPQ
jgi:hypothetical protein